MVHVALFDGERGAEDKVGVVEDVAESNCSVSEGEAAVVEGGLEEVALVGGEQLVQQQAWALLLQEGEAREAADLGERAEQLGVWGKFGELCQECGEGDDGGVGAHDVPQLEGGGGAGVACGGAGGVGQGPEDEALQQGDLLRHVVGQRGEVEGGRDGGACQMEQVVRRRI